MKQEKPRAVSRGLLRAHWKSIALITGLNVVQSLLQVAVAVLMQFVIDAALENNGQILFWGVVVIVTLIALVAVHSALSWYIGSSSDHFIAKLRRRLLTSAAYSREAKLQSYHSGELLSRGMEDVKTVCDGAMSALPALIGQLTSLIAAFAAVLLMYPPVAGVLMIAAVAIGGMVAWLRPFMKRRHRHVRQTEEQMTAELQEDLQQLELIQSLQVQEQALKRFDIRLKNNLAAQFKRRLWSVGSNFVVAAVSNMGTGVLLLWGAAQIAGGVLSYGSLTSLLELLSLFKGPVVGLSGLWTRLTAVEVAQERLLELLDYEAPAEVGAPSASVDAVVFEDVTFCYPGEETPVLQQFNARFPLNKWACLTGLSGKGKTTLFKLILGLYSPQKGRVYLETDRGQLTCSEATRNLFAYVPQDYALFSGTVIENLLLVAPQADEAQIRKALEIAGAEFIWDMTSAEQTQVRENNTGLSRGQLQRLAIARAVLMDRPVFLLDECTSALDAQTEDAVLKNLRALNKRAILVTHRPDALDGIENVSLVSMETK